MAHHQEEIGPSATGAPRGEGRDPHVPHAHNVQQGSDSEGTEPTTYERFVEFLAANPVVIPWLIGEIRRRIARTGNRRVGANMLVEKIRWDLPGVTDPSSSFRINNNFGPFLAREVVRQAPDLNDVFANRASRADRHYNQVRYPGSDILLGNQPAPEPEPEFPSEDDETEGGLW